MTFVLCIIWTMLLLPGFILAHPGNTNQSGCHKQSSTNTTHCHNEPDSVSLQSPTGNSTGEYDSWRPPVSASTSSTSTWWTIIAFIFSGGWMLIAVGWAVISEWLKDKKEAPQSEPYISIVKAPTETPKPPTPSKSAVKTSLRTRILEVLENEKNPLKAREIKQKINKKYGTSYTRKKINQTLYGNLKKSVVIDDKYRWKQK